MQMVRWMIKRCDADGTDIQLALLNYRNTPLEAVGASPAQLLMSRRLRSRLPVTRAGLAPAVQRDKTEQVRWIQLRQRHNHDRWAGQRHKVFDQGVSISGIRDTLGNGLRGR